MKLRIGGLQTVITQALEKEQAASKIPTFNAISMHLQDDYEKEWSWFSPAGVIRGATTQRVDVAIPRTCETFALILKMMWANKTTDIFVEPSGTDKRYHFSGAFISEVHDCSIDDPVINICITFSHFYLAQMYNNTATK